MKDETNFAKDLLASEKFKLQSALEDMDKTNHPISDAEKLKAQIESIDKMLSIPNIDQIQDLIKFFSGHHIDKKFILEHIDKLKHERTETKG